MVGDERPALASDPRRPEEGDPFGPLGVGVRVGKYEILETLGQGGFGITYRARDTRLDRDVAVKEYLPTSFAIRQVDGTVLPRSTRTAEDFIWGRDRFLDEAKTLARLEDAPGIVNVYDFMEANGTAYMVMALLRGETLDARLRRDGRLPQTAIELLLYPLLDGLELVHAAGFLHRDIKPANVLVDTSGRPTLIDFGAARVALEGRTQAMTAIYTPGYAAPEQMTLSGRQGPWTDIFALSSTLYHCVAGRVPTSAMDRATGDPLVPAQEVGKARYAPSLLRAIDAGLALKAADRPQNIAALRRLLSGQEAVELDPVAATRRIEATVKAAPERRRSRTLPLAAGLAALALAGGGAWYALRPPAPAGVEDTLRRAEAEQRRQTELVARLRGEEAARKAEADTARKAAEEKAAAEAVARRRAEDEARARADAEAARKAAADKAAAEQAERQRVADETARRSAAEKAAAEAEARRKAEEEAKARAEVEAARRLAAEKAAAEAEARRKAEDEAKARAEAEAADRRAEQQRIAAEANAAADRLAREKALAEEKARAEAEAARRIEDGKRRAEEEAAKSAADFKRQAEAAEASLRLTEADRKRAQVALTAVGHNTGGADGAFGPRSRAMIAAWQRSRNEPDTGFLTGPQWAALQRQAAPALARHDEEQRKLEEDKRKAEDEAKRKAEDEAKRKAEEEAKRPPPAQTAAAATPPPAATTASGRYVGMTTNSRGTQWRLTIVSDGTRLRFTLDQRHDQGSETWSCDSTDLRPDGRFSTTCRQLRAQTRELQGSLSAARLSDSGSRTGGGDFVLTRQ